MNPKELLQFVSDEGIKMIDLRFVDLPGLWQHFSISANEMEEEMFEEGLGFDGSSIRGFQEIPSPRSRPSTSSAMSRIR